MKSLSITRVLLSFLGLLFLSILSIYLTSKFTEDGRFASVGMDLAALLWLLILSWKYSYNFSELKIKPKLKELILLSVLGVFIFLLDPILNLLAMCRYLQVNKLKSINFENPLDISWFRSDILSVYSLFRALILAPIYEELIFRKIFISELKKTIKPWIAIGISSFLFSFWHMDLELSIPIFISGILLGTLYHYRYSLWSIIYLHSFINLLFSFVASNYIPITKTYFTLLSIVFIGLIAFLIKYVFKHRRIQ